MIPCVDCGSRFQTRCDPFWKQNTAGNNNPFQTSFQSKASTNFRMPVKPQEQWTYLTGNNSDFCNPFIKSVGGLESAILMCNALNIDFALEPLDCAPFFHGYGIKCIEAKLTITTDWPESPRNRNSVLYTWRKWILSTWNQLDEKCAPTQRPEISNNIER